MNEIRRISLLLMSSILILMAGGCAKYSQIRPTSVNIESVRPMGLRSAEAVISVGVYNPASEVSVSEIYATATRFGKVIGNVAVAPITLKARTEEKYELKATVSLEGGFTFLNAMGMIGDAGFVDEVKVNLYAKVKVKGGASRNLKFEELPLKELIKFLRQ